MTCTLNDWHVLLNVTGLCAILFVMFKVALTIHSYRKWRKIFHDCPGSKDFHWLLGDLHKVPEDSEKRLQHQFQKTCEFPRFYRSWHGSFLPVIFVHHPDTVKLLLKSTEPKPRGFGGGYEYAIPWLGEGLLISDGERWSRARRLLTPAFHFDILKPYVKIYNEATDILLDKMKHCADSDSSFELFSHISLCTLDIILKCAFSYENNIQSNGDSHPYVQAVNQLAQLWVDRVRSPWFHFDFIYNMTDKGKTFKKHCAYVHSVTEEIIDRRRQTLLSSDVNSRKYLDFLDILLSARDETGSGLTQLEIRNEADTFLFEGHDTTSSGISWILYSLAQHPEIQDRAQAEIDSIIGGRNPEYITWEDLSKMEYLTRCIKEGLRLHCPVPFVQRKITKELKIDDVTFPAGTSFTIHIYNLHHNPQVWNEPMKYDPDRFCATNIKKKDSFAFVPFSAGPRNCIGQHFAMNEEKVVISRILRRYRIELDKDHTVKRKIAGVMQAENGIKIKLHKREHSKSLI